MKLGIVFAGQGSQYVGMGQDFYKKYPEARNVYDNIQMDFDLKDICFNGPIEKLNSTEYTQSCVLATSMAIYEVLKTLNLKADYLCGLSLGEYSALCASKAIGLSDALEIVRERGLIMANSLPAGTSKMAAVMSDDIDLIKKACETATKGDEICTIANYNAYNQIVITGTNKAVVEASEFLKENGVRRIVELKVSGAFHSPLLSEASEKLMAVLKNYEFNKQEIPVIFNVNAKENDGDIKNLLKKQIMSSVLFYPSIEYMVEKGVDTFIEIGPGHTLSGLIKKINKDVRVFNIDKVEDVDKLLQELSNE
ncbi:MAG: ACP S-malonyltransferase [Erysipelotrichaceae bacterium]|nr:ACP S-malonyltransferase [Erysipelotrichaceae bacterium]